MSQIDQWNRTERGCNIPTQPLIYDKGDTAVQWGKEWLFSINVQG